MGLSRATCSHVRRVWDRDGVLRDAARGHELGLQSLLKRHAQRPCRAAFDPGHFLPHREAQWEEFYPLFSTFSGFCSLMCILEGQVWQKWQIGLELVSFFGGCTALDVLLIYTLECSQRVCGTRR